MIYRMPVACLWLARCRDSDKGIVKYDYLQGEKSGGHSTPQCAKHTRGGIHFHGTIPSKIPHIVGSFSTASSSSDQTSVLRPQALALHRTCTAAWTSGAATHERCRGQKYVQKRPESQATPGDAFTRIRKDQRWNGLGIRGDLRASSKL
jgi:hypothetical protein